MATYASRFSCGLLLDTTSQTVVQIYDRVAYNAVAEGLFSIPDVIGVVSDDNAYNDYEYIGYIGGGWIGGVLVGEIGEEYIYFYFSDNDFFPSVGDSYSVDSFSVCFLAGTMIATPAGGTPVETLAIGDLVLTRDGRAAPVRWIGVQTIVSVFADRMRTAPVRITTGVLGEGLPARDLLVSPDHALFLDGVLVQAGALVNGTTIVRETAMPERFTYFHVELDDHALILAEGVPAETFLDTVTRRRFDNFAEYEALYGDTGATIAELPTPRIKSARQLPQALARRLAARAAAAQGTLASVA